MDMASNLRLIDDCFKILKRIVKIVDSSEEAKILDRTMNELIGDIHYIKEQLLIIGDRIENLQIEVNHVIFRQRAELKKRQRSNPKTTCKAAIQPCLPF